MVFTEDYLSKAATRVKKAYLDNGVPPTEEISKIASEDDLNMEQVKRVCEESNKSIKVATKASDPQLEFPVADPTIVLEGLNMKLALVKEAGSEGGNMEELYGYGGKEVTEHMSKLATVPVIEANSPGMSGTNRALFKGAMVALRRLDTKLSGQDYEIEKVAGDMINILYKEAQEKRSLNGSYTCLMKSATTDNARNRVHDFYAFATEALNKIARSPVVLTTMGMLDKTASVMDPSASIVTNMNKYIALRANRDKTAATKEIFESKISTFGRRALQED